MSEFHSIFFSSGSFLPSPFLSRGTIGLAVQYSFCENSSLARANPVTSLMFGSSLEYRYHERYFTDEHSNDSINTDKKVNDVCDWSPEPNVFNTKRQTDRQTYVQIRLLFQCRLRSRFDTGWFSFSSLSFPLLCLDLACAVGFRLVEVSRLVD